MGIYIYFVGSQRLDIKSYNAEDPESENRIRFTYGGEENRKESSQS